MHRTPYVRAFDKMLIAREESGLENGEIWRNGESVMRWWVGDDPLQMTLFDYIESEEMEGT